jgi:hypothetical protein
MKSRYLLLSLLVPVVLFAGENLQNAGLAQFFLRTSSAFNTYTDSPSVSTQVWMKSHIWRIQSSSPYFDSRLSWMPNTWAYLDLYGIPSNSSIASQHPEWILHDGGGKRLYIPWGCGNGTCPNYAGDITNSNFKSWWIANAQSLVAKGYKGFWIDDVNMEFRIANGSGADAIPYDPDTGSTMTYDNWRRHIAEFTEEIRAALPTAEIVHNSIWFAAPTRYNDQYVIRQIKSADYLNCERGVSDPGLGGGTDSWSVRAFLDYVDAVHSYGKNVILDEYAYDGDYGLAGYYLISNGDDALGNQQVTPNNWWSGYELNLGRPVGSRYDWQNLIRRDFLAGMVLLNPPKTTTITVTLPIPLTLINNGKLVTTVTLQPGEAVVLTGAAPLPANSVNLSGVFSRVGAYNDGTAFTSGGLDGNGFAYSKNLLGSAKTLGGIPYTFGAANAPNAVSSSTIPLPAGRFSALNVVGSAVNGNQVSQKFTINYSDGTAASFVKNLSDWIGPANYSGETSVLAMPHRNVYSGSADWRTFYLYNYSFVLDKGKTVKSFTLPNNSNVVIFAATLTP